MNAFETAATVIAVLAPLVGVPLTVITFYLRGLREQQVGRLADLSQRVDLLEASVNRLAGDLTDIRRDYATKEEWLRESMWARGQIEKLCQSMARAETELDGMAALATTVERTVRRAGALPQRPAQNGANGGENH